MKIIIDCTQDEAMILRDALHNYYHETKPLISPRAKNNGSFCKVVADSLHRAIYTNHKELVIKT